MAVCVRAGGTMNEVGTIHHAATHVHRQQMPVSQQQEVLIFIRMAECDEADSRTQRQDLKFPLFVSLFLLLALSTIHIKCRQEVLQ